MIAKLQLSKTVYGADLTRALQAAVHELGWRYQCSERRVGLPSDLTNAKEAVIGISVPGKPGILGIGTTVETAMQTTVNIFQSGLKGMYSERGWPYGSLMLSSVEGKKPLTPQSVSALESAVNEHLGAAFSPFR